MNLRAQEDDIVAEADRVRQDRIRPFIQFVDQPSQLQLVPHAGFERHDHCIQRRLPVFAYGSSQTAAGTTAAATAGSARPGVQAASAV